MGLGSESKVVLLDLLRNLYRRAHNEVEIEEYKETLVAAGC